MPHPRLHKSSIIVGIFLAILLILIMVPGRIVEGQPWSWMTFEHGWPFNFLRREAKGNAPAPPFVMYRGRQNDVAERRMLGVPWLALANWRLWEAPTEPEVLGLDTPHWDFNGGILVYDIAIATILFAGMVAAWEIRRRRRPSAYSLSLSDLFVFTLLVSAILGWAVHLAREHERERRLIDDSFHDHSAWFDNDEECIAPVWMRSLFGERLMPGFIWRTSSAWVSADEVDNESRLAAELSQMSYLRRLDIDQRPLNWRLKLSEFKCLERLETLEFSDGFYVDDARLNGLKQLPHLRKIILFKEEASPEEIARLNAELPNCRMVDCYEDW